MPVTYPVKNPPETLTKTSHGIQIKVGGEVIGAVTSFVPGPARREFTHVYELNPLSSGHPIDVVPNNLTGFEIRVSRYDIWRQPFERVFGGTISIYEALGNQDRGFDMYRYFWHPDGYREVLVYRNTWIREVGRTFDAGRDRVILVNGSFVYLRKDKIS